MSFRFLNFTASPLCDLAYSHTVSMPAPLYVLRCLHQRIFGLCVNRGIIALKIPRKSSVGSNGNDFMSRNKYWAMQYDVVRRCAKLL